MAVDNAKDILKKLEEGVKDIFQTEKYKNYLQTMSKFHKYSANNSLWLFFQNPAATHVAGFNTWKKEFNRYVKKGEKSMTVLAPCPYKVKVDMEVIDPKTQKRVIGADGKPITEPKEFIKQAFKPVPVFDISQTEGEPLPKLTYNLEGDIHNYNKMMFAIKSLSPVPISFETLTKENGYYHLVDKRIVIKQGMSQKQTLKTALHEVAHAILHDVDIMPEGKISAADKPFQKDSGTREVEAESIAFVVCQHFGIDTSEYSFGYLAGWSATKEVPELKASLETIRATANQCITFLEEKVKELGLDIGYQEKKPLESAELKDVIKSLHDTVMAANENKQAGLACHRVAVKRLRRTAEGLPDGDKMRTAILIAASSPTLEMLKVRIEKLIPLLDEKKNGISQRLSAAQHKASERNNHRLPQLPYNKER